LDRVVHELRTATKRARALVRLFGALLGSTVARAENARLRDAAQALAGTREIAVARALLHKLRRKHDGRDRAAIEATLRGLGKLAATAPAASEKDAAMQRAHDTLHGTVRRLRRLRVSKDEAFATIALGLRACHRRCRRQMQRARATSEAAEFHEWRKLVKRLFYQLQLPGLAESKPARRLVRKLDALQERLGDAHDVHALAALLRAKPAGLGGAASAARLLRLLAKRERKLHARCLRLGTKLFAAKTTEFADAVRRKRRPLREAARTE
jgi:CHAD domain-containing protein